MFPLQIISFFNYFQEDVDFIVESLKKLSILEYF